VHAYAPTLLITRVNFTGVERTNTEINVHLFDNANVYMTKNSKVENIK